MTDEDLNPDVYEQLYLLNIESQRKMSISDIEKFCISIKEKSAIDLLQVINLLEQYEKYFLSYEPIAKRLDKMGRTQLSKILEELLIDIRETLDIFVKLHQDLSVSKPSKKIYKDI